VKPGNRPENKDLCQWARYSRQTLTGDYPTRRGDGSKIIYLKMNM
jgi:hypothetical protein